MRHYEVGQWSDFVRNLVSAKERVAMEEHLESGCAECRAMLDFLAKVNKTAASERTYDSVTPGLSTAARRIFANPAKAAEHPERLLDTLRALVARLTYDSAADLQPAGARAARAASRQVLYEAGDYSLDLRFDRERDSMQVTLVGQVANQREPHFCKARLPVIILSGNKVVAQTASNEFGEFSLEYLPQRNLRLCVPVSGAGVRLEVPLKRLLEEHEG